MKGPQAAINRILVIRIGGIGDVVMTLVMLPSLRAAYPNAEIHYLTDPGSAGFLKAVPEIDRVLTLDRQNPVRAIWAMRRAGYDLILDLWQNPRTALMTALSGAKQRVSFDSSSRRWAYNQRTPFSEGKFLIQQCLDMLRALNIPVVDNRVRFPLPEKELAVASQTLNNLFPDAAGIIGVLPTGNVASKRCDPDRLADFAQALQERYGWPVLIMGGPADEPAIQALEQELAHRGTHFKRCPAGSILQLGAVLSKLSLVLANDSGPCHISAASGAPTVALFGPFTSMMGEYRPNPVATVQLETLDCIRCHLDHCPKAHECFRLLPVAQVLSAAAEVLTLKSGLPTEASE